MKDNSYAFLHQYKGQLFPLKLSHHTTNGEVHALQLEPTCPMFNREYSKFNTYLVFLKEVQTVTLCAIRVTSGIMKELVFTLPLKPKVIWGNAVIHCWLTRKKQNTGKVLLEGDTGNFLQTQYLTICLSILSPDYKNREAGKVGGR